MIVTTRLLTTSSLVSAVVSRNVHIAAFQRDIKVVRNKDSPKLKHSKKKSRDASRLSVDYSSRDNCKLVKEVRDSRWDSDELVMEPFVKVCEIINESQENFAPCCENFSRNITTNIDDCDANMGRHKCEKIWMTHQKYKSIRSWKPVGSAATLINSETDFVVKILSYNILAQNLLETHKYLYLRHNKEALNWERRMILVQQELLKAEANIICLQEMLVDHLDEFLVVFKKSGYDFIYKKRTNDKRDGLLLLYRADQFKLMDHAEVELYQPNVNILNRDNVAIVAKFSLIESPETHVVVSTTHLLYNPRRNDVRLAQTQMLFAELERLAFIKFTKDGPTYHPIIISGDFNLQPYSGVYKFITEGSFEFKGRGRNLEPALICGLGNSLIPPSLLVTDNCQHYNSLLERLRDDKNKDEALLKKPEENENVEEKTNSGAENKEKFDTRTCEYQKVEIIEGQYAKFSSGSLTHPFNLTSIYQHKNANGEDEATTYQGRWVTVDYIFYSGLEPLSKYNLPTICECKTLQRIPNNFVGSDHLCLGASFKLDKKRDDEEEKNCGKKTLARKLK